MDPSLLQSVITGIHFRSNATPNVDIEDPFNPGPPDPVLTALQPQITLDVTTGDPIIIAPYGAPSGAHVGLFATLGIGASLAVLGLAAYGTYALIHRVGR